MTILGTNYTDKYRRKERETETHTHTHGLTDRQRERKIDKEKEKTERSILSRQNPLSIFIFDVPQWLTYVHFGSESDFIKNQVNCQVTSIRNKVSPL